MCSACATRSEAVPDAVMTGLEDHRVREVVQRMLQLGECVCSLSRSLVRRETAQRLDTGDHAVRDAQVEQETDLLRLLATATTAAVDARVRSDDWPNVAAQGDEFARSPAGEHALRHLRQACARALVDHGVGAEDAVESLAVWDRVLGAVLGTGIEGLVRDVVGTVDRALACADDPSRLLAPASPITVGQAICIGLAAAAAVAMLISCCGACWPAVALWQAAAVGVCLAR